MVTRSADKQFKQHMTPGPRVHDRDQRTCGPRCAARTFRGRGAAPVARFGYDFVETGVAGRFA
ncbi:hypothetical protein CN645_00355 [Burkholderia sp. IDO3]|nr:hypothetical protein DCN14_07240 [Burkholderia sp. IDO3]PCD63593.1 hypothetical protein CN645_00355 [Burkholderia sp. IDO3]